MALSPSPVDENLVSLLQIDARRKNLRPLQLRSLLEDGLVEARAESRHRFYRARREVLGALAEMLERMWDDKLWSLKLEAELEESRRGPRPHRRRRKT